MFHTLALTPIFGIPVVAYGGMATLLLVICTAIVGFLSYKGNTSIPFIWHPILAGATIVFALIHGLFGLSMFLGF